MAGAVRLRDEAKAAEIDWAAEPPDSATGGVRKLEVMVEGGSRVVRSFYDHDLVDRYVMYVAPALFTGNQAVPLVAGPSAESMDGLWRGRFDGVRRVGTDLRVELIPATRTLATGIGLIGQGG